MNDEDSRAGSVASDVATMVSDLERIGEALIRLEAWSRIKGYDEIADQLDRVAGYVERCLVR